VDRLDLFYQFDLVFRQALSFCLMAFYTNKIGNLDDFGIPFLIFPAKTDLEPGIFHFCYAYQL